MQPIKDIGSSVKPPDGVEFDQSAGAMDIVLPVKERGSKVYLIIAAICFISTPVFLFWSGELIEIGWAELLKNLSIMFIVCYIVWHTLVTNFGKMKFRLDEKGGTIFTGVRGIGKREKFYWSEIDTISEAALKREDILSKMRPPGYTFLLKGIKREITGRWALKDDHRKFLLSTLSKGHEKDASVDRRKTKEVPS